MSLAQLSKQGRIRRHKTTADEIGKLLRLVERDIADSKIAGLSADRRFATAYNAILQCGTILLFCSGYRTKGLGHHATTIEAIGIILGGKYAKLTKHFDECREKRNIIDYTCEGRIPESEAAELVTQAEDFLKAVVEWICKDHPDLLNRP